MSNRIPFSDYIRDLRANLDRGDATEHTHRPALKTLLESIDSDIVATNEPRAHGADLVALHLLQSPKLGQFITEFPEKGTNEVDRIIFKVGGASSSPFRTREQDAPATKAQAPRLQSEKVVRASRLQSVEGSDTPPSASPETTTRVHINATQYFGGIPQATVSDLPIKNQKSAITNPCVWSFRVGGYQVCEKWLKDRKGRTLDYPDIQHYQRIVVALSETIRLMATIDQTIEAQGGWPGAFDGGDGRRSALSPTTREEST